MQPQTITHPHTHYLDALNPEQREAVEATDGPVLVLAGAGTGKTRVLTTRIAHLITTRKAYPSQILAVTFTNKAAAEMRHRVADLLASEAQESASLWLGTFHSTGAKILRRHAELVGLTPQFTILDDDDQQRLIKALLADNNIDHSKFPTRAVQNVIQGWKDRGLTPDKIPEAPGVYTLAQVAAKLYPLYQQRLKNLNCTDFGDLLLHNLVIFQSHPDVLRMYAEKFKYILVDEYQDTNVGQYLWLRLLAAFHKNLCCVGDDDQSIYGWRGAEVGNILKFEVDYPGAQLIRLERNYRSTQKILKAASGLIANNESRLGKTLFTDQSDPDATQVRIKSVWDDNEEARFVGEEIEAFQRDKILLRDMAVLVRAGYQTRSFEERFMTLGLAYKVVGGLRFYERMEVRDAIAYLRIIAQPHDDLAFERIINTPKRGIGKATLEQLHTTARARNCSLGDSITHLLETGALKGKTAATLQRLMEQLARWRSLADTSLPRSPLAGEPNRSGDLVGGLGSQTIATVPNVESPSPHQNFKVEILAPPQGGSAQTAPPTYTDGQKSLPLADLTDLMLEESGYRPMWQADTSPEAAGRLENLRELVRALNDFPSLAEFLEHVGLVTDAAEQSQGDMISIMSLHAAKGLEFSAVFLAGWEEGLFPSQRTLDELGTAGLEEERRLAYVGITRARKHLTISHAANRRIYNQWQSQLPSRFLGEIPTDCVEFLDGGPSGSRRASGPAMFQREVDAILGTRVAHTAIASKPARADGLTKGARVFHQKFGNGVILNLEGDHLEIAFKHAGIKKILAEYVEVVP
ncbi:MAG: ATP-dependent helicase [Rickettsiales bacterium]